MDAAHGHTPQPGAQVPTAREEGQPGRGPQRPGPSTAPAAPLGPWLGMEADSVPKSHGPAHLDLVT